MTQKKCLITEKAGADSGRLGQWCRVWRLLERFPMDLPMTGYKEDWDEYFSTITFTESIAGLEAFTSNSEASELSQPLTSELTEMVAAKVRSFGNPAFSLVSASKRISVNRIRDILATIRSRLLDFMLKIDEEYGFVTDINKLSEQKNIKEKITTIMSKTIIHNTGDGNVVNTGSHSALNITTSIQKNDFVSLSKLLADNGMAEEDIAALQSVIDTEKPDLQNKTFGQKVNGWIKKMLDKSLDASWKIGIGAAGKLLADSIQQYYGMK